mmetsp:Transcript_134553/g.262008  ORF Transcript_134553/g.262008 Transcript_134553/m.262008 type:complete len:238 (-) Transcript_134553:100-813(-)
MPVVYNPPACSSRACFFAFSISALSDFVPATSSTNCTLDSETLACNLVMSSSPLSRERSNNLASECKSIPFFSFAASSNFLCTNSDITWNRRNCVLHQRLKSVSMFTKFTTATESLCICTEIFPLEPDIPCSAQSSIWLFASFALSFMLSIPVLICFADLCVVSTPCFHRSTKSGSFWCCVFFSWCFFPLRFISPSMEYALATESLRRPRIRRTPAVARRHVHMPIRFIARLNSTLL